MKIKLFAPAFGIQPKKRLKGLLLPKSATPRLTMES